MNSKTLNKGYVFTVTICVLILSGLAVTNVYPLTYPTLIMIAMLLFVPAVKYIIKNEFKINVIVLLLLLMFFLPLFKDFYNYKFCISVVVFIITALVITKVVPFEQFSWMYIRIIFVIALISLVGYAVVNYTTVQLPLISMNSVKDDVSYKVGFIYNYLPYQKDRNCGAFWEPGLFSTHLVAAYLLTLKYAPPKIILYKIVFLLTILTTKSSAGYGLLLLCILLEITMRFCRYIKKNRMFFLVSLIVAILMAALFILSNEDIVSNILLGRGSGGGAVKIFSKLKFENVLTSQRGSAVIFWLTQFLENPLIGRGFVEITEQYIWDTCTSFMLLGGCGILGATYTYCWIKGIVRIKNINIPSKLIVFFIVFIILNKEPHTKMLVTWMFLFYLAFDTRTPGKPKDDGKLVKSLE